MHALVRSSCIKSPGARRHLAAAAAVTLRHISTAAAAPPTPPPRRTRPPKDPETLQLPDTLDILCTPGPAEHTDAHLPPPHIFQDALDNLLISLHPQTQHRAAYASPLSAPTEPTLALYCPIEGGDYVIDATVRELARRTDAEVLVLDAAQLAAGEWGHFGPGNYSSRV